MFSECKNYSYLNKNIGIKWIYNIVYIYNIYIISLVYNIYYNK